MAERTRHGWFCEKCWQFHDTEVETYHEPVGGVSDTGVLDSVARLCFDGGMAETHQANDEWLVVCDDHVIECKTAEAARKQLDVVKAMGACKNLHRIVRRSKMVPKQQPTKTGDKQMAKRNVTGATPVSSKTPAQKEAEAAKPAKAPKTSNACGCGCGGQTFNRYLPGHDAKHKSALINAALDGDDKAEATLKANGWGGHLDKARTSRQAKAEATAKRDAAKAAAKVEKAQKAAAAKAAAKVEATAKAAKTETEKAPASA